MWLDDLLFGLRNVFTAAGVELPTSGTLKFGPGFSVTYDAVNRRIEINFDVLTAVENALPVMVKGSTTTSDDTPTVLLEVPASDPCIVSGFLHVQAVNPSPGGLWIYGSFGGGTQINGGTPTAFGTPTENTFSNFPSTDPSITTEWDAGTNMFRVVATGLAGVDIQWSASFFGTVLPVVV